ncbi:MAG: transposase, partial [Acidobacteriaceae bacterium]|nr:transposase [Acidobacteriaceae bacterium]
MARHAGPTRKLCTGSQTLLQLPGESLTCPFAQAPQFDHLAISNHRLVSFADDQVTFRWRDSAHHNKQRLMTLH